jgi:hypothetical protein
MKRNYFIFLFSSAQIIFIFLQIHRHTLFIDQSFAKQKNERKKIELTQTIQELSHQLHIVREHANIKQFAHTELDMQPIQMNQIKKLPTKNEIHDNRSI